MLWISNLVKCDDGSINIYGSASGSEHGPAFDKPGTGKMFVYKLREDGFISLATDDKNIESVVATREKAWHGGELHLNIKAKSATVAVYITDEEEVMTGNVLGMTRLVEGYSHEDCVPFSGDAADWVPEFKSGNKISDLKDKTIVFEVKFTDGEIFSLSGDFTDVYNTEGARFRKFGKLPE